MKFFSFDIYSSNIYSSTDINMQVIFNLLLNRDTKSAASPRTLELQTKVIFTIAFKVI